MYRKIGANGLGEEIDNPRASNCVLQGLQRGTLIGLVKTNNWGKHRNVRLTQLSRKQRIVRLTRQVQKTQASKINTLRPDKTGV